MRFVTPSADRAGTQAPRRQSRRCHRSPGNVHPRRVADIARPGSSVPGAGPTRTALLPIYGGSRAMDAHKTGQRRGVDAARENHDCHGAHIQLQIRPAQGHPGVSALPVPLGQGVTRGGTAGRIQDQPRTRRGGRPAKVMIGSAPHEVPNRSSGRQGVRHVGGAPTPGQTVLAKHAIPRSGGPGSLCSRSAYRHTSSTARFHV
jgi:hypothetical protein